MTLQTWNFTSNDIILESGLFNLPTVKKSFCFKVPKYTFDRVQIMAKSRTTQLGQVMGPFDVNIKFNRGNSFRFGQSTKKYI